MMHHITKAVSSNRLRTLGCALLLFAINAYICRDLFPAEFTERMESIEGPYMSISRWAVDHWGELDGWFPLWFTGRPFWRVYQPGLHVTVAALAREMHWTPQHAYHFLTGLTYALGPVTLFWLCYAATRRRGYAVLAGLLYSLVSPLCFVVPLIRHDTGGLLLPRRYQVLVHYGEGPHISALFLLPLAIWVLDRAATRRDWRFIGAAPLALAAVVLTNWPGAMGLSMAILAYLLAKTGAGRIGEARLQWPVLAGVGAVAYLLACYWIPPSIITDAFRNAHQSDATSLSSAQLTPFTVLALGLAGCHFLFRRLKTGGWVRFFVYFTMITGVVSVGREWFGWRALPQPNRFQLEWEMAAVSTVALGAAWVWRRCPRAVQIGGLALLVLLAATQVVRYGRYAQRLTRPLDITTTIEYKMARWFGDNMAGSRVFAPGNVSLWMNMFNDVPQVAGCCDQSVPTQQYRIAVYVIYTGQNAGTRDAEISLLWLRVFGADAIGVTGPASTEVFKPFWNSRKFEGVLPVLWRQGDNAVYRVPRRSVSLAHVVPRRSVVSRPAENGLDVAAIEPLVAELESPSAKPASFRWISGREAEIHAAADRGDVVFVQIAYDAGWRAVANGRSLRIAPDALGMMVIDPPDGGGHPIRLLYDGGAERRYTKMAAMAGFALLGLWTTLTWLSPRRPSTPGLAHESA